MPTVEELLGIEDGMGNTLVIDNDLRSIKIPSSVRNIGVVSDDDVLRLNFCMPRHYGEFDLSEFIIRVNYTNAQQEPDAYEVDDANPDEDVIYFSWLVGRHAVMYKGNVTFGICLKKLDGDGNVDREFNTSIATLPVLEGLETTEIIVQTYPDLLELWRRDWEKRLFSINYAYEAALRSGFKGTEEEWLASLKGERGDTGIFVGAVEPTTYPYLWFDTSVFNNDDETVYVNLENQTYSLKDTTLENIEEVEVERRDYTIT